MIKEIIIGVLMLSGSFLCLIASLGLVRFSDFLSRMHSSSIAGSFGVVLLLITVAVKSGDFSVYIKVVLTVSFLYITIPVSAHLLARAFCISSAKINDNINKKILFSIKEYNKNAKNSDKKNNS